MANNRYYLHCPKCGETCFMGKSLGDGVYNNARNQDEFVNGLYRFMWAHLLSCAPKGEWSENKVFDVYTEYSPEAPGGYDGVKLHPKDMGTEAEGK